MLPWIEIITLIADLVKDCFAAGRTEEQIKAQIKTPGPLAQMRLENAIRQKLGIAKLSEWRQQRTAVMTPVYAELETASDQSIDEILATAKEVDWTA